MNRNLLAATILFIALPGLAHARQLPEEPPTLESVPAAAIPPVTLDLKDTPIREALKRLFDAAKVPYFISPNIQGTITLKVNNAPFEQALKLIARTNSIPLTYTVEQGTYRVMPRPIPGPQEGPSLPKMTMELRDASVRQALEQMFKTANASYTLSPSVSGTVTARFNDLPFEAALQIILKGCPIPLTYRRENGLFIVEGVMPPEVAPPPSSEERTLVIPLKNVTPEEMLKHIDQKWVRPDGINWLKPVPARNALLVHSNDPDGTQALKRLIEVFDVAPRNVVLKVEVVQVSQSGKRETLFSSVVNASSGTESRTGEQSDSATANKDSRVTIKLTPTVMESGLSVRSDWDVLLPLPGKSGIIRLGRSLTAITKHQPGQTVLIGKTPRSLSGSTAETLFFLTWEVGKNPGPTRVKM